MVKYFPVASTRMLNIKKEISPIRISVQYGIAVIIILLGKRFLKTGNQLTFAATA
jgi:hypothetical protein